MVPVCRTQCCAQYAWPGQACRIASSARGCNDLRIQGRTQSVDQPAAAPKGSIQLTTYCVVQSQGRWPFKFGRPPGRPGVARARAPRPPGHGGRTPVSRPVPPPAPIGRRGPETLTGQDSDATDQAHGRGQTWTQGRARRQGARLGHNFCHVRSRRYPGTIG
jgi:hypothetical protein